MDKHFLYLEDGPEFEPAFSTAVARPAKLFRQYLENFSRPSREAGNLSPLHYFAIQVTDPLTVKENGGGANLFLAVRGIHTNPAIDSALRPKKME